MSRQITVKPYRRSFRQPLWTSRGEWSIREGCILRVETPEGISYGEVAPLPEFGTETVAEAAEFLKQLVAEPELPIPPRLPCCAFGLSAASLKTLPTSKDFEIAALLPAGVAALEHLSGKLALGHRSLKWKIGVESLTVELKILEQLVSQLPAKTKLRLDANGGLTLEETHQWMAALSCYGEQIEFVEQPLAVGNETVMADLMQRYGVSIGLDESLNGGEGLHWLQSWQGILVVKPLLMGDLSSLEQRLQSVADRVVLSSVFESGIGRANAFALAERLPGLKYALGFDTLNAFDDDLGNPNPETVWNALDHLS